MDLDDRTFNVGTNLDRADVGDVETRGSTADTCGDVTLFGVHRYNADLDRFPYSECTSQGSNQIFTNGISVSTNARATVYLPGLLLWNRTLDVVEKLHEQSVFHYLKDDSMSHHTDSSILYAGDNR